MDKILLHEYVIPAKGVKRKIVYHFSDTHLTEYDELSSAEETEKAKKAIREMGGEIEEIKEDLIQSYIF